MKKQSLLRLCTALLLLLLAPVSTHAQWLKISASLDSLISAGQPRPFNGNLLITQNGLVRYRASHGKSHFETGAPLREDMQFFIGSVSKQFTAVLVLTEWENGRLRLDVPIKTYLPDMTPSWADTVTIHHLLSHTSGLVSPDKPLAFRPGEKFLYSPLAAFEILSKITERTSGKSYANLTASLFRKCGLKNTTIPARYKNGKLSGSYIEESDGKMMAETYEMDKMDAMTPGGGIISTIADLNRWNECLHKGRLLGKEAYDLMTREYAVRPGHRWGHVGYGYGLQNAKLNGLSEYSHSGAWGGFISTLIYYPETSVSVVILENVSWDSHNSDRSFYIHDQLRKIVNGGRLQ